MEEANDGIRPADIAEMPRDLALIKMENESIMAMAAARPRDYGEILGKVKAQIEAFPSFAAGAVYCKPVGREGKGGPMKYATGLSVRAAESLAEAYGFNRVATTAEPTEADPEKIRITATFVDYQTGRVWSDSEVVSPWYKSRGGPMVRMPDDRFLNVHVKARRSILVREVILRSVPPGLKAELQDVAERHQADGLSEEQITKMLDAWGGRGVSVEALEKIVGKAKAHWSRAERAMLLHLWTALEEGETTLEEILDSVGATVEGADIPKPGDEKEENGKTLVYTESLGWMPKGGQQAEPPQPAAAKAPKEPAASVETEKKDDGSAELVGEQQSLSEMLAD